MLDQAWRATGLDRIGARVAHWTTIDIAQQSYQSDRPYPPFFSLATERQVWLDPSSGVERNQARLVGLVAGDAPTVMTVAAESTAFIVEGAALRRSVAAFQQSLVHRPLDAWAVLADWRLAPRVMSVGHCIFREYPRVVLERIGAFGRERLYLDEKTHLPVKFEREEPHYLWGQVLAEYEYQTWTYVDGTVHPGAVFRLVEGALDIERLETSFALVPRDSLPMLRIPDSAPMSPALPRFLQPIALDTERVASDVVLLRNPGYREGVVFARDTVFLLDATQGEGRARLDSACIARLYPTRKAVVVIVTDLAWPHIAGVRFWVARGATIVSRTSSRPMLERVVRRRWTRAPDGLETRRLREPVPFHFVGVGDSLSLAGGALRLYPIDGVASEGALMVFMPASGVLWASDYVQQVGTPSLYSAEVVRAAQRVHIDPRVVVAEHIGPQPWSRIHADAAGVP
ncbi:MAG: hypothetical protein ABJA80_01565 [bacterium]